VSALVALALARNLADGAVLTGVDGIAPVPRLVTDAGKVSDCAGSRFIAAPTLSAMNRAVRDGLRRLAVVGTPCQMTAVAQMRMNPLEREDFEDPVVLTIGLFCNWALDHRRLSAYLGERLDTTAITGMDILPPPAEVLVVKTTGGEKRFPLSEVRKLIPHTCFICPDMTAEWCDLSVGMYEGRPGWNTLLVRTPAGAALVDRAVAEGWLAVREFPGDREAALAGAALAKKERSLRNARRQGHLGAKGGEGRATLRVPAGVIARMGVQGSGLALG
jgi:coenzyme F420 hydrogenase subunit beta